MSEKKVIKGFKGFAKDMKCRDFQFEEGKEYEHKGKVSAFESGFHFCENPLDVFNYYNPSESAFHEVEGYGESSKDGDDSKVAVSNLKIGASINFNGICKAAINFIHEKVDWKNNKESNTGDYSAASNTGNRSAASNTGDYSAASNTGDYSAASNTGYQSAASNTGDYSAASNTGYQSAASNTGDYSAASNTGYQSAASVEGNDSVAIAIGIESKAKACKGSFIVISDWRENENGDWYIHELHRARAGKNTINGVKIQPDTWYWFENGELRSEK